MLVDHVLLTELSLERLKNRVIMINKQHLGTFTDRLKHKSKIYFIIMSIIQFSNLNAIYEVQSKHFDSNQQKCKIVIANKYNSKIY